MTWLAIVLAVVTGATASILWLRRHYLVVAVHGRSMTPTYAPGVRVLARRVRPGQVRAGDVVIVDFTQSLVQASVLDRPLGITGPGPATGPPRRAVKRVAAAGGDAVPAGVRAPDSHVPAGQLVLLGDNPNESLDSRGFGYVPAGQVVAVVLRRLRSTQSSS